MDPPPNQQAAEVNLTRALEALSPYLNNPRKTVVRLEVFVLLAVGLLFLQLLLGSIRRWCGHWSVQGVLWVAYTASFPLITYTLGQMVSSPIKNALYPVWAVFLFWAAGCTNSMIAYDLEDNKRWKGHLFELIQYVVYLVIIARLLAPTSNSAPFKRVENQHVQPIQIAIVFLQLVLVYANVLRLVASWMVRNSGPSKFVADYMRKHAAAAKGNNLESSSPNPLKIIGYYLVCWGSLSHPVTIDKIWFAKIGGSANLLNSYIGGLGVNDTCLSFALSHLLKRRYFEMECAEANRPETRKFVLQGLLPHPNDYRRAFKIIEVELGFLYDFFFTKYATIFHMEVSYLIIVVLKLISIAYCGAVLLRNSPTLMTLDPVIEISTRRLDVIITIIIIASFLAVEALQLILYVTSDWATVSLACLFIRIRPSKWILLFIRFLRRYIVISLHGYWQNRMGQSSVIARSMHFFPPSDDNPSFPDLLISAMFRSLNYIKDELHSRIFSGKTLVQVPDLVKMEIVSCLKEYKADDPLTNGQTTLRRHGIHENFSWTLKNQSQTSIMLVWHIATEYCSISLPSEAGEEGGANLQLVWHQGCCGIWKNKKKSSGYQQVAITLSRYCAYLISFVPDLLPGNSKDTLFILEGMLGKADAKKLMHYKREAHKEISQEPSQDFEHSNNKDTPTVIYDSRGNDDDIIEALDSNTDEIINVHDSSSDKDTKDDDIFRQGLKLGRQLEEEIEDEDVRWRVLAEFWAETIIYIAPSDNAKAHMERLAQGGEFLTHVWALLTHAGILQRGKKETDTPEDIPDSV